MTAPAIVPSILAKKIRFVPNIALKKLPPKHTLAALNTVRIMKPKPQVIANPAIAPNTQAVLLTNAEPNTAKNMAVKWLNAAALLKTNANSNSEQSETLLSITD